MLGRWSGSGIGLADPSGQSCDRQDVEQDREGTERVPPDPFGRLPMQFLTADKTAYLLIAVAPDRASGLIIEAPQLFRICIVARPLARVTSGSDFHV
jgi:hypothetical protein